MENTAPPDVFCQYKDMRSSPTFFLFSSVINATYYLLDGYFYPRDFFPRYIDILWTYIIVLLVTIMHVASCCQPTCRGITFRCTSADSKENVTDTNCECTVERHLPSGAVNILHISWILLPLRSFLFC